jgi:hypothetical protein
MSTDGMEAGDAAKLPKHEVVDYSSALASDKDTQPLQSQHRPVDKNADIFDKTYMFPEEYNALRRELYEHYPNLFMAVGYAMAFDSISFIEMMDAALDTRTTFDSDKVASICKKYLNLLRVKRGVSEII